MPTVGQTIPLMVPLGEYIDAAYYLVNLGSIYMYERCLEDFAIQILSLSNGQGYARPQKAFVHIHRHTKVSLGKSSKC